MNSGTKSAQRSKFQNQSGGFAKVKEGKVYLFKLCFTHPFIQQILLKSTTHLTLCNGLGIESKSLCPQEVKF